MSLEARVDALESRHDALEATVREHLKITEATHGVVSLMLKEQRENKAEVNARLDKIETRLDQHDQRFDAIDKRFDGVDKRFDGVDKRFDKIEEILIQIINRLPDHP